MNKKSIDFNFEEALSDLQAGKSLAGKNGVLTPLIKKLTEAALNAEINAHLASSETPNRRNGTTPKKMKSPIGNFELNTPRDRVGTFAPQIVKKHQTHLTPELENKIVGLFSLGTSYRDIQAHINEIYDMEVSVGTLNLITDQLIPELKQWQQRPLEEVYPVVWLDAIHYKIKDNGRYVNKAVYTLLGLNIEGKKELLGLYLSESEGANYWLSVLTDVKNRGVKDILIACVDGLTGFPEAISSLYPGTEVQLCVVHQIRNSVRYVASKHQKEFIKDLKPVYQAISKDAAQDALLDLADKWGKQYPMVIKSWQNKWENLSAYFKYPHEIRKIIYTTNAVEAVHRQFRKLTKTKGGFANDNSLLKLLYAGIIKASEKWTMPIHNWSLSLSQLAIYFEGRLDSAMNL